MNNSNEQYILTVNAGSSSIKLAVFTLQDMQKKFEAAVENIGTPSACLVTDTGRRAISAQTHIEAAASLTKWLHLHNDTHTIAAVGHRIVHGGPKYYQAIAATSGILKDLRTFSTFDPEHLPIELDLVTTFQKLLPKARQVLCFDTAFHHNLPIRSKLLPIPRRFAANGVRRYGFHGLSYAYVLEELRRVEGEAAASGKVIIAHLGSGASLAALYDGKSIDTTMSMTPASGIPMSTRSGDLDPGLLFYLSQTQSYDVNRLHRMIHFESGLLGISETSADMKQLLETEQDDERAKDAVDIFCYNVTKTIGAFAAALGGLNTLIFTGGMGENAPKVRAKVCEQLDFIGIRLDRAQNEADARLISVEGSPVGVHIIRTDEAVTIARETRNVLQREQH